MRDPLNGDEESLIKEEAALEQAEIEKAEAEDEKMLAPLYKDRSPEARAGRRRVMIRAVCGEFVGSTLFFFMVCAVITHLTRFSSSGGPVDSFSFGASATILNALAASFSIIPLIYSFSDISGSHFNPAVTFATWITKRTSNRKFIFYVLAQLLGSCLAMLLLWAVFPEDTHLFTNITVTPQVDDKGRVFAMEFVETFILVFVIFSLVFDDVEAAKRETMTWKGIANSRGLTVYAATPQSKTGFAPISIGFVIGCLVMVGGTVSGGAFNPARMFGPALFSGKWDYLWLYWIAQFSGAAFGAGVRGLFSRWGGAPRSDLKKEFFPHHHATNINEKRKSSDVHIKFNRQ